VRQIKNISKTRLTFTGWVEQITAQPPQTSDLENLNMPQQTDSYFTTAAF